VDMVCDALACAGRADLRGVRVPCGSRLFHSGSRALDGLAPLPSAISGRATLVSMRDHQEGSPPCQDEGWPLAESAGDQTRDPAHESSGHHIGACQQALIAASPVLTIKAYCQRNRIAGLPVECATQTDRQRASATPVLPVPPRRYPDADSLSGGRDHWHDTSLQPQRSASPHLTPPG
jgi:hypothetical protein